MLLVEDADDFTKHQHLCKELNLDEVTVSEAWSSFENIRSNFNLEGDSLHWLGCAVFVACRKTTTPTVGQTVVEGNGVNLTSLLRNCNLSLAQFFNKIKKWADMADINDSFRQKIDSLEGNFAVSCNVFKEYNPIFIKIFKPPTDLEETKHHRNRKQRAVPCNTTKVFEFIWNLFVTLKGEEFLSCSEDLVTSFHLLLACCDLAFKNAFLADRRDLLNPDFDGLPSNWSLSEYVVPAEAPCIIDKISGGNSNMATEAKYMKQYHCKKFITNLFGNGTLQGHKEQLSGLFEPSVFDANFKNIIKHYEAHLLNKGDFDERIFLAEYRRRSLLKEKEQFSNSSVQNSPFKDSGGESSVKYSPGSHQFGEVVQQPPATPLTGRRYLGPKEQSQVTPLSTAMQSVTRLQALLSGRLAGPSETLSQLFQGCSVNPTEKISEIVKRLGDKFVTAYTQQACNLPEVQADYAKKRLQFGVTLFYKLIESILQNESTICKDISALVQKEIFYECILACSLEIVIFSYNSQRKFPWILQVLEIQPYNFVKVIELVVRSKDQLSRDVVKHLSLVEETILESLAWKTGSQLWEDIKKSGQDIPKFEETALPGNLMYTEMKPIVRSINIERSPLQSPGPSAVDRFQSPITNSTPVKKQLFPITRPYQSPHAVKNTRFVITDEDGKKRLISFTEPDTESISEVQQAKPKRTGSLAIFFRKFYNLAGVRMEHLCTQLGITDLEFKRRIFTVFEYSVRKEMDLIRDRHLDQLLMCAVYVICKFPEMKKFMDIMKCYRMQPQAGSHVYRNVLLRPVGVENPDSEECYERGDIINFYNKVYVKVMKDFLLEFTSVNANQNNSNILLSPLPAPKLHLVSPKLQLVKNVFVKPYESPNLNAGRTFNYCFSRSPSKDLKDINRAINNGVSGKRLLIDDEADTANKRIANRKVQSLIEERKSQNME